MHGEDCMGYPAFSVMKQVMDIHNKYNETLHSDLNLRHN